MKIDPLRLLFLTLFAFGFYLLINRLLGHSATLEIIVSILTGSIYIAVIDLYTANRELYNLNGNVRERLIKIEKDIEQIKEAVTKK